MVARTAPSGWYAEELFARFAVEAATGSVDGGTRWLKITRWPPVEARERMPEAMSVSAEAIGYPRGPASTSTGPRCPPRPPRSARRRAVAATGRRAGRGLGFGYGYAAAPGQWGSTRSARRSRPPRPISG